MKVYRVHAAECTVVFQSLDNAIDEVRMHIEHGIGSVDVVVDEMTQEEYDALEEHPGY